MDYLDFKKLDLADVATILDRLSSLFNDEISFDPVETTILSAALPFYDTFSLLDISDHGTLPALQRYVLSGDDEDVVLDYTNESIYKVNEKAVFILDDHTVIDYVRFFFNFVKGRHGRFLIVENVDDIKWKEEQTPSARTAMSKIVSPVEVLGRNDGVYHLTAKMIFKDSLFKSDIYIDEKGLVTLKDEELLVEDMPVLDDILMQ